MSRRHGGEEPRRKPMEIRYDYDSSLYRWADDGGYQPPELDPAASAEVPDLADAA